MLMSSDSIRNHSASSGRSNSIRQESFRCGVGCLYLPVFSKRKSMVQLSRERTAAEEKNSTVESTEIEVSRTQESTISLGETEVTSTLESSIASRDQTEVSMERKSIKVSSDQIKISKTFSLERFDCMSNASGIVYNLAPEEAGWKSPFYDLPVELIRTVNNEAETPVNAAFVFDYHPKKSMNDRRKYILAQSKSLQVISSGGQISWAPSSCPPSPSYESSVVPTLPKS